REARNLSRDGCVSGLWRDIRVATVESRDAAPETRGATAASQVSGARVEARRLRLGARRPGRRRRSSPPGYNPPEDGPMAVDTQRRLFTCAEYETMLAAGILSEDDRVELIEGVILQMSPIGSRHAGCVKRTNRTFSRLFLDRAIVSVQDPVFLNDFSEPE